MDGSSMIADLNFKDSVFIVNFLYIVIYRDFPRFCLFKDSHKIYKK